MTHLTQDQWKQLKRAAKATGEDGNGGGTFIWRQRENEIFSSLEVIGLVRFFDHNTRVMTTPDGYQQYMARGVMGERLPV